MKTKLFYLLIFIVFLSACKEDHEPIIPNPVSDAYQEFIYECKNRGVKYNIHDLDAIILQGTITQDQVTTPIIVGTYISGFYNANTKIIYLDTSTYDYILNRKSLVFHELGHAYLHRQHITDRLPDNVYKSMMNPAGIDLPASEQYKMTYYIDELFNQNTPTPQWSIINSH